MTKRLEVVDLLRGYSIFTIALMHLLQTYDLPSVISKVVLFGGAGVHVFLLCSGFGLYLSYLYKPLSYGDFMKRRFGKIYLPYIIIILLTAIWQLFQQGVFDWKAILSHIFLYKMFSPKYESSLGGQMWFISTIIQFYLFWPLFVYLIKKKQSILLSLLISLIWATFVGIIGKEDERVWNSFFLQYVWEFVLGMWIADYYYKHLECFSILKWHYIFVGIFCGMGLTGLMAWNGGILKLYNDIPSLVGYMSVALFVYKFAIPCFNKLFCYTNKISYEWYLVHNLVYSIIKYYIAGSIPTLFEIIVCFIASYGMAFLYSFILKKSKIT